MERAGQMGARFSTRYCAVLDRDVQVVLIQQSDGTWELVRCLDKNRECLKRAHCPLVAREPWWQNVVRME